MLVCSTMCGYGICCLMILRTLIATAMLSIANSKMLDGQNAQFAVHTNRFHNAEFATAAFGTSDGCAAPNISLL
jgi:hypothetical protein